MTAIGIRATMPATVERCIMRSALVIAALSLPMAFSGCGWMAGF